MKEINTYIRVHMPDIVIRTLEAAGVTDMTVDDLHAIRCGLREEDLANSVEQARSGCRDRECGG